MAVPTTRARRIWAKVRGAILCGSGSPTSEPDFSEGEHHRPQRSRLSSKRNSRGSRISVLDEIPARIEQRIESRQQGTQTNYPRELELPTPQPLLEQASNAPEAEASKKPGAPVSSPGQSGSNPLLPTDVTCYLKVYQDEAFVEADDHLTINPGAVDQFSKLANLALEWLHRKNLQELDLLKGQDIIQSKFYRKSGWCELVDDSTNACFKYQSLSEEEEWAQTIQFLIFSFVTQPHSNPFHIELHWNYSYVSICRQPEGLGETLRNVLHTKRKKNVDDKDFWSCKDIHEIFTRPVVEELVKAEEHTFQDPSVLCGEPLDLETFISRTLSSATRLLAMSVCVELPLKCLYRLVMSPGSPENYIEDVNLPLKACHCPDPLNPTVSRRFDKLVEEQGGFNAWTFYRNERPHRITKPPESVMPLVWASGDKASSKLGNGSFGEVFRVKIDPNHQFLHDKKDQTFALKRFYHHGARTAQDFKKEEEALMKLSAVGHGNIATIYASWTHNDIFYMLMPCADRNLRHLLKRPHPELEKGQMLAIIGGMLGLADGLREIHSWSPTTLSVRGLDLNRRSRRNHGYHNDLKPENILVFDHSTDGTFTLQISDFGSARIGLVASGSQQILSHLTDRHPADAGYASPDHFRNGKHGRANDVWALGCIFLEILLWALGPSDSSSADIQAGLLAGSTNPDREDPAFWCLGTDGKPKLKPFIAQKITQLDNHYKRLGVWEDVLRVVRAMLNLEKDGRLTAPKVFTDFIKIHKQAKLDLQTDPNFYLNGLAEQNKVYEVSGPSHDDSSFSSHLSGIDEKPDRSAHGDFLDTPDKKTHRRYSTSNDGRSNGSKSQPQHLRLSSLPDNLPTRKKSPSIVTHDLLPANQHHQSPSISVSDIGDTDASSSDSENLSCIGTHIVGSHSVQLGREDFANPRSRRNSGKKIHTI